MSKKLKFLGKTILKMDPRPIETIKETETLPSSSKENVRVTISDTGPYDRRARWINEKIRLGTNQINISDKSKSISKGADSGFQDDTSSFHQLHSTDDRPYRRHHISAPYGTFNSEKWRSTVDKDHGKARLRNTCSLNCSCHEYLEDDYLLKRHSSNMDDEDTEGHYCLSRQNGVRHSTKNPHYHRHNNDISTPTESAYSISSESEASQAEPLDDGSVYKTGKDKGRKQSVFFAKTYPWDEDSMTHSLRDLSPSTSSVLEAAWRGEVSLLETLLSSPENLSHINAVDNCGRTPLHLAAACGHVGAVELLLQKGADVEVCDIQQKATPLMCAAGCGSLAATEVLLNHGAQVNAGYENGKTGLHWAVQAESVECVRKLLLSGALQNPPLAYSETALHVAAALGNLECLQLLIEHGADVTLIKGNTRSTALHLAAEEGSIECIKQLLASGASHSVQDARGHTPLHISAASDTDSTAILLQAGADPNIADANGRTPLHCAVARGSRAAECVRLLIEAQAEVNAQDCFGYTPLHLAGVNESSQCASILLHNGADVTAKTKAGTTALSVLVRRIPDVIRYLVERLDSAVTVHDHDPADPDCEIRLDFRAIVPSTEKRVSGKNSKSFEQTYYHQPRKETEFLTCLLAAGNKKILAHPLSEAFLHLKWRCVRKFFWASLCFQIALVLLYTSYVINVYLIQCPYDKDLQYQEHAEHEQHLSNDSPPHVQAPQQPSFFSSRIKIPDDLGTSNKKNGTNTAGRVRRSTYKFSWLNLSPDEEEATTTTTTTTVAPPTPGVLGRMRVSTFNSFGNGSPLITTTEAPVSNDTAVNKEEDESDGFCQLTLSLTVVWSLLVTFTLIMAIKEFFQLVQSPFAYVLSSENWGQWALIGSVGMTAWPASNPGLHLSHWQYPAAAFGIFLAYSLMLLQVGRQPALGLYVQMLGKVAANFGLFLLAYVCLLIAFALAFCVIFPGNPAYSSLPRAFLKVLTMMVGEVDYEEQFYGHGDDKKEIPYPITAHVLHSAFVVFISIILMNLLVGLAVHDIQGLQKGARLNRLSRQTTLICRLESFIFSKRLQACLPSSIGKLLQKNALLVPSSYNWSFYFRPNDPRDKRLPKDLKKAALRLATANYTVKHASKIQPVLPSETNNKSSQHTHSSNSNIEMNFRRLDQRIDKLQNKIDAALKTLNENSNKILLHLQGKETVVQTTEPVENPK